MCETSSCVLFESIRWLYLVPSFKGLNEYDQLILIEQSWSMLFLLTSAEMKKFTEQSRVWFFLVLKWWLLFSDENDSFDEDGQYVLFQSIIKELIIHSIDQIEYTLLKLILIFNNRKLKNWFDLLE